MVEKQRDAIREHGRCKAAWRAIEFFAGIGGFACAWPEGDIAAAIDIDPVALKAPGVLAGALPQLQEAVDAIRTMVASDPALITNLTARGLTPDDVVGLSTSSHGVTLFVSSNA